MKTRFLIISACLMLIAGCTAAPKRHATVQMPPIPPAPAGKTKAAAMSAALAANFALAAAVATDVTIDGPYTDVGENGGVVHFFVIGATQLASNELHIQQAGEPTFNGPQDLAVYSCYPYQQDVVAIANADLFTVSYMRSLNVPCVPAAAPLMLARTTTKLSPKLAKWRKTIRGVTYKIGTEIRGTAKPGVQLFTRVKA